jgi:hypothetical protein
MNHLAARMDKAIKAKLTPTQAALYQEYMDEKLEEALRAFAYVIMEADGYFSLSRVTNSFSRFWLLPLRGSSRTSTN